MAHPDFVPVSDSDRVRTAERLPAPRSWKAERPGDLPGLQPPSGRLLGKTGPDQGYGLKLVRRFHDRLDLQENEHAEDAISGALAVGLKRATSFGRAPVIYDFEFAFSLFGFLGNAPADLLEFRRSLFAGASHDYWAQRRIADMVPLETLRLTPAQVRERLPEWPAMLAPDGPGTAAGG